MPKKSKTFKRLRWAKQMQEEKERIKNAQEIANRTREHQIIIVINAMGQRVRRVIDPECELLKAIMHARNSF